jgi:hypothetical protein
MHLLGKFKHSRRCAMRALFSDHQDVSQRGRPVEGQKFLAFAFWMEAEMEAKAVSHEPCFEIEEPCLCLKETKRPFRGQKYYHNNVGLSDQVDQEDHV